MPARRSAIFTVDARLDPQNSLAWPSATPHVIRNAGGRASDDAIGLSCKLLAHRSSSSSTTQIAVWSWRTIKDQRQSVLDDIAHIRNHPLVPKSIPVHGYIYDVTQGTLTELEGVRTGGASA
jgi:carbonic anhydrase